MTHPEMVAEAVAVDTPPAIWNPNAAANWSLLFSPAFGAYLNMLNWRALGETERAASSRAWFYTSLGFLGFYVLIALVVGNAVSDGISRLVSLVFLLSWYFASGRPQARYVKERYGKDYVRKSWGKPLAYAVGGFMVFLLASFVVGVVGAFIAIATSSSSTGQF